MNLEQVVTSPHKDCLGISHVCAETGFKLADIQLSDILEERGSRYGKFTGHAQLAVSLKETMRSCANWDVLADDQKEALDMIAHKVGRILNGDPDDLDSWIDVAGYARLVADRLSGVIR